MLGLGRTVRAAAAGLFVLLAAGEAATVRTFGSAGIDAVSASGRLYEHYSRDQVPLEPCFRAGVFVWRGLAVGADLALVGTFPERSSPLFNTPDVCFGPNVSYFPRLPVKSLRPYASSGWGLHYTTARAYGWRSTLALGCGYVFPTVRLGPALELGWYHDEITYRSLQTPTRHKGNMLYLGLRLVALR